MKELRERRDAGINEGKYTTANSKVKGKIGSGSVSGYRVYQALRRTPFVSLYSTSSQHEDLAEYLTVYDFTQKDRRRREDCLLCSHLMITSGYRLQVTGGLLDRQRYWVITVSVILRSDPFQPRRVAASFLSNTVFLLL